MSGGEPSAFRSYDQALPMAACCIEVEVRIATGGAVVQMVRSGLSNIKIRLFTEQGKNTENQICVLLPSARMAHESLIQQEGKS